MRVLEAVLTQSLILKIWLPKNLSNNNEVSGCSPRIHLRKTYFFYIAPVGNRSASLSISLGAGSSALLVRIFIKKKTRKNNNLWVCGQPVGLSKGCGQPNGLSIARHIHRGSAHEKRPNVMGSSGYKKCSRMASTLSKAQSRVGA